MGNHIQNTSDIVTIVANADTWIEGKAIQQLEKTAELSGVVRAAGMPDLHPGRGYPIGAAFLTKNIIYPALVGNDIGCGMSLWSTDIKLRKVNLDKYVKRLTLLEQPLEESWYSTIAEHFGAENVSTIPFAKSLGSIGGGNHFSEFQQIDSIYQPELVASNGLEKQSLVLLVHSGSRGLGEQILRKHVENFGHQGLSVESPEFSDYMQQHQFALRFAELNRELIARRMLNYLSAEGQQVIDVNHNLVSRWTASRETSAEQSSDSFYVHRKGATPADQGLVMIPGSRGDFSYLVKPLIENLASQQALLSLAHGAGRKWIRSECKARLSKRYSKHDLMRTSFGSRVVCDNKELIFEEAPEAYKSIDSVIQAMISFGLIEPVARFRPVLTYKTGAASCGDIEQKNRRRQ